MNQYSKTLSVVSGIALLVAIPFAWPYAYFQLLRWLVCGTGILNAYEANKHSKTNWVWTMAIIAILFNPIAPIYLDRGKWMVLDLIAGILMFVSL